MINVFFTYTLPNTVLHQSLNKNQLCLGIIASGIGFVLRPAWCRSVSRYRMDAMNLG